MEPIEIEGIHLTREGDNVIVEVQIEDIWYPVIKEHHSFYFDHFVTSKGIVEVTFRQNLELLKNPVSRNWYLSNKERDAK